jgi:SNF2 family DNA or RNA helicase
MDEQDNFRNSNIFNNKNSNDGTRYQLNDSTKTNSDQVKNDDLNKNQEQDNTLSNENQDLIPFSICLEPTYCIYFNDDSLSLRIVGRISESLDHAKMNQRLIVNKKRCAYTNFVNFANYNKKINQEFMFFVGQHTLNLGQIQGEDFDDFIENCNKFDHYLYESFIHWSSFLLNELYSDKKIDSTIDPRYSKINMSKPFFRYINVEEKQFYLLSTSNSKNNQQTKSHLFLIEKSDLFENLVTSLSLNSVFLVFDSILKYKTETRDKFAITVSIYLSDSLKYEGFAERPSDSLRASEMSHLNRVIEVFFPNQFAETEELVSSSIQFSRTDSNSELDENDLDSFKNENLFDLIYELRKKENSTSDLDDPSLNSIIQLNSCLKPLLRPYQIKAIKWMTKRESIENNDEVQDIHPIYMKLVNSKAQTIYFHKYYGMFCTERMPVRVKSYSGGILADEMGLGKTLEVLALILINKRENFESQVSINPCYFKNDQETFSCLCGETPSQFVVKFEDEDEEIVRKRRKREEKPYFACVACGVYSHFTCLNYNGK